VRGDVIVMRNGDHISGEILAMAEGRLVVRTAYAGEVTLEWNAIEALESGRPLAVMLHGVVFHARTGLRVPFSRPAPGRKSTDSTLLVGLSYAW
jgi:hypothetical protein